MRASHVAAPPSRVGCFELASAFTLAVTVGLHEPTVYSPRDVCDQLKAAARKGGASAWEHFRVTAITPHALTMNGIPTEENFTTRWLGWD